MDQQQQQQQSQLPTTTGNTAQLRARNAPSAASAAAGANIREGRDLLLSLSTTSPARCSVDGELFSYHYSISGPLVCFVATDRSYPKKLAFCYLDEVRKMFWEHVAKENPGQEPAKVVAATNRPYAFIQFDRDLRNLRRDFSDPSSRKNMQRLQENLNEIQNIMRKNIEDIMQRGNTLDNIRNQSQKLHEDSRSLAWGAKKLNYQAMLRRYAPIAVGSLIITFILWFRFYL